MTKSLLSFRADFSAIFLLAELAVGLHRFESSGSLARLPAVFVLYAKIAEPADSAKLTGRVRESAAGRCGSAHFSKRML